MHVEIAEVRRALENDELVPFFQPLVELRTGRLTGFEVLTRWLHPEFGFVLPENFISLVEDYGLIGLLTEQLLRKALSSTVLLPDPLKLAVNISPSQLQDLTLPRQIQDAAEEGAFSPARLTVEITESALLGDLNRAKAIAQELKALGCRLSLDDFGTGYSSMAHLQALPFDELKIDRSFVSAMTRARESRKIVAALVGLGQSLNMMTVGEGIETEQQADMLLWLGCEVGQGWLYGKAVPADQISGLIAAGPQSTLAGLQTPGDGWAVSSLEALPTHRLAQLQAIYDGSPVGLCFLDRSLRYVSLNQRLADLNGASVAAHLGKTVKEMVPETYEVLEPYLLRALDGEAIPEVEVLRTINTPGDQDWTAMMSYQPAFDEADEVIGISVAVADITEHKRTKEALRESDERQQNIAESHNQVPWIMDAAGNTLPSSSQWAQSLTRKKTRNLGWLEPLHADDLEPTMKTMRESLRTGKPIDIEYRVLDIEGDWKRMRSRGSPRFGEMGEIVRWYGSVEEIPAPYSTSARVDAIDSL